MARRGAAWGRRGPMAARDPDTGGEMGSSRRAESVESMESMLARYAAHPDAGLRDRIVESHRFLVRSVARKFVRPGLELEDLIQTAWMALIGGIDRFDPAFGTKFSSYAVQCMVGEIKRYLRDRTWALKVPRRL